MSDFEERLLAEVSEFNQQHFEGLCRIAKVISDLADAINDRHANHQAAPKQPKRIFRVETFSENGIGTARSTRPGEPLFVFGSEDLVPAMQGVAFEGELVSAASVDVYGGLCNVAALDLEGEGYEK